MQYPLLAKYFMPELRKIQDIAIRERHSMGIGEAGEQADAEPLDPNDL
jgi:hypothetical protein